MEGSSSSLAESSLDSREGPGCSMVWSTANLVRCRLPMAETRVVWMDGWMEDTFIENQLAALSVPASLLSEMRESAGLFMSQVPA